jgi:hypothetical protein
MNGLPGIGGSLGACAFCGKPFVMEILTRKSVPTFEIEQVKGPLAAHQACMDRFEGVTSILEWPAESPVRQAIERHNASIDAKLA